MAGIDKRITELNLHTSLIFSDIIPIVSNGETRKTSYGSLYYGIREGLLSSSQQITDLGFISASQTIDTGSFAITGSNLFVANQTISGSLFVSGASEFGGNLVPKTPQGATLGTLERPFSEIFVSSGSINIASDILSDPNTTLSNVDGNILVSAGGMRLVGDASFIAATGSFSYLSGSLEYIGEMSVDGNINFGGQYSIITASINDSTLTLTKTDSSTINLDLPFVPIGNNADDLNGIIIRTLYVRNNTIIHNDTSITDFLSGSDESFGTRNITSTFLSNTNFKSKTIYFRVFGQFDNTSGTNCDVYLQIGNDILTHSNLGATLSQPAGHPFEIKGEVIFTNGNARVCYSLGHCSNNGDFKMYPLGDATQLQDVTSFSGGDFKISIPTSGNIKLTTYAGYLQIYN